MTNGDVSLAGQRREKLLAKDGDVFESVAQRRQHDAHLREAIVEVLAEAPGLDLVPQLTVRRGDDPHVDLDGRVAADPYDLLSLEDAEKLGLQGRRQFADLVDEDGAAARRLEEADAPLVGTGERPLLVAEEQRLGE